MIRVYVKAKGYDKFVSDMKKVDQQLAKVQPDRTTFVYQDEEGNDKLRTVHHSFEDGELVTRWDVVYHGKMVKNGAQIDEDGNVTTPAEMWDEERADIYLQGENAQQLHDFLKSKGYIKTFPNENLLNRSGEVEQKPNTPDAILSGEEI